MNLKHNPALTPTARELRKNMTKEEKKLWYQFLREYPVRFLKQKVIDTYIVDFYCSKAQLVIEIDGAQHFEPENMENDKNRTEQLQNRGLMVIRFSNYDINHNFRFVCENIDQIVKNRL